MISIFKISFFITSVCISLASPAQLIKISSGTHVVNNGAVVIQNANVINDGGFTNISGANVIFRGASSQLIQGNGSTNFYGLELDKSSNNLSVQTNIKVAGALKFTKGSLDLTYNSVQLLYPNGLLQNESEDARIFSTGNGFVFIEQPLNAPNYNNPGNLGLSISSAQNLGATVVYRGHDAQTTAAQQQSANRYYRVIPANNSNGSYTVKYTYFDAELNGIQESGAYLFQKTGNNSWTKVSNNGVSNVLNFRESIGLTSLDWFTLFSENAAGALPLQLLAFTAQCKDNTASLQWITANEVNTKAFIIEQSINGNTWTAAQTVASQNGTLQHTYATTVASNGALYYRLRMEDKDGKYTYSPVKKISCDATDVITVGPNPTYGPLTITFQLLKKDIYSIQLFSIKGQLLMNKLVSTAQGLSVENLSVAQQPAGTYLLKITGSDGSSHTQRIIKQ